MKRNAKNMILLPATHAERIWLGVLVSGIFLFGNAIWKPQLEPLSPADLDIDSLTAQHVMPVNEHGLDFIFRPLFYASRRPQVTPAVVIEEALDAEMLEAAQVSQLSEYQLLGVFASGSVEGVIISKKDDDRTRLYLGESLNGWRLTRSTYREALFENIQGETFTMELSVASALPDLPVVAVPSQVGLPEDVASSDVAAPESPGNADQPSPPPAVDRPSGSISFATIQARKREQAERELQSRQASGE